MNEKATPNRLRLARVESGLTQAQLADRVDVTRDVTGKTLDELFWPLGEE